MKIIRISAIIAITCTLWIASPGADGQVTGANNSDPSPDVIAQLQNAASTGNVQAMGLLGTCYLIGKGVEKDPEKAKEYLWKAANGGDAVAQVSLAREYAAGGIVPKDVSAAQSLCTGVIARNQDDTLAVADAKLILGTLYLTEDFAPVITTKEGYSKLGKQGLAFLKDAAGDGQGKSDVATHAARCLGMAYANGIRTRQDFEKASKWFLQAANGGDADSMYSLFLISCNQPNCVSASDGADWLAHAADAGLEQASKTKKQLDKIASKEAAQKVLDDADKQEASFNPYYAEGKHIREEVADQQENTGDLVRDGIILGIAALLEGYEQGQEEKQWVPGVEHHLYYDGGTGGVVVTDQAVQVLPDSFFPQVRSAQ